MDELKHCNLDMQMDLQLLVSLFLCLYLVYLVFILPFRMVFFHNVFCFLLFMNLQYLVPSCKIYLQFLMKMFRNKLFTCVLFSIIHDSLDYILSRNEQIS